jgi:hypothetical protein
MQRHEAGLRDKGATSVTAGIRMFFARNLLSTAFLDTPVITSSRHACRMAPAELRAVRDSNTTSSVKLPACLPMLQDMRARLWDQQPWSGTGLVARMAYLGCTWGFDQSARISEYTPPEPRSEDHCIRLDDLSFYFKTPEGIRCSVGSILAASLSGVSDDSLLIQDVMECRVQGASSKGKRVVKAKLIGRRSEDESRFLSDLVTFISRSGARGDDELFSIRSTVGAKTSLSGRTVRDHVKETCRRLGLPPSYFSSHSLRKGAITHMRANGASEDDRRDRGNYAPGSQVMHNTYDYATGLGPLASNGLPGALPPTLTDVQRILPAVRPVRSHASDAPGL